MPYDEQELKRIEDEEAEYARKAEERKKKRRVQGTLGVAAPLRTQQLLQAAPLQAVPLLAAPLQAAPLQAAPLQAAPLQSLQGASLQGAPLQSLQGASLQGASLQSASAPLCESHVPWFLAAAQESERLRESLRKDLREENDPCKDEKSQGGEELMQDWAQCITFAGRAEATPGVRNAQRPSYLKCLQDLCAYVLSWKDKRKPLHLVGEIGCGKTSLLRALALHCKMEVEFLQEMFLESPTHDVIEQLGSQGLERHPKLWVIEHYDTLTPQWRQALKSKGFANMLKTGCVIMTSWPSSKQPSPNTLELTPWTTDTKMKFLKTLVPKFSHKEVAYLLGESGDCMYGALECAKLWGKSLGAQVLASTPSEDTEYCPLPPVNLRLLLEESFTDRWSTARSLALETCDNELSLELLQELSVGAAFQGRCDISSLSQQLDTLSHLELASRKCPDVVKSVMCQRLVQKQTLAGSRVSMSKFSSGTLIPLPQALLNIGRARTSARSMDELVLESRDVSEETTEHLRDTCKNLEDVQLYAQASGRKWISPFKTK